MSKDFIGNSDKKEKKNLFQKIWGFIRDLINAISGALPL